MKEGLWTHGVSGYTKSKNRAMIRKIVSLGATSSNRRGL